MLIIRRITISQFFIISSWLKTQHQYFVLEFLKLGAWIFMAACISKIFIKFLLLRLKIQKKIRTNTKENLVQLLVPKLSRM